MTVRGIASARAVKVWLDVVLLLGGFWVAGKLG